MREATKAMEEGPSLCSAWEGAPLRNSRSEIVRISHWVTLVVLRISQTPYRSSAKFPVSPFWMYNTERHFF